MLVNLKILHPTKEVIFQHCGDKKLLTKNIHLFKSLEIAYLLFSKKKNIIFSCSTWVKSRFCSWSGIEGSGKAWPLMPEERKSQACRCLDSWDVSTTSCRMRPSAHWPFSPQVRQKRLLHVTLCIDVSLPSSVLVLSYNRIPLQISRGSLCTPSWLRGSSPCWTTSCSTWWVLRWVPLKSRTSVSSTSSPSSLFPISAPST